MSLHGPWSERPWQRVLVYGLGRLGRRRRRASCARRGVEVVGVDRRDAPIAERADRGPCREERAGRDRLDADRRRGALARACRRPGRWSARRGARGRAGDRRGRAGLSVPRRPGGRRSPARTARARRRRSPARCSRAAGMRGGGLRQHRRPPLCDTVDGPPGRRVRRRALELPARDDRPSSRAPRRCSTSRPTTSTATATSRPTRRRSGGSSRARRPDDVAVLNADDPVGLRARPRRRAGAPSRGAGRSPTAATLENGVVVERRAGGDGARALPRRRRAACRARTTSRTRWRPRCWRARSVRRPTAMRAGLRGFRGLPHRTRARARAIDGVAYYDDSKGTNVDATAQSLEGFADRSVHLILGGRDKGADFRELARGGRAQGAPPLPDRRDRRRASSGALGALVAGDAERHARPRRRRGGGAARRAARRSCSRRPARASTSSATSTTAATSSSAWSRRSSAARRAAEMAKKLAFDKVLFTVVVLLVGLGLVMVYSATRGARPSGAARSRMRSTASSCSQLAAAAIGLVADVGRDARRLPRLAAAGGGLRARSGAIVVLLVAVLFAPTLNDTRRWLFVGGLSVQPSELAKLALVLFLAYQTRPQAGSGERRAGAGLPAGWSTALAGGPGRAAARPRDRGAAGRRRRR